MCCPVQATARHKYLRQNGCTMPISSIHIHSRLTVIKSQQITDNIRHAMTVNFHHMGIAATEVSACYLRAVSAVALLCGKVDMNLIQIISRWHKDAMIIYLYMQAQPIVQQCPEKCTTTGITPSSPTRRSLSSMRTWSNNITTHTTFPPKHYMAYGFPIGLAASRSGANIMRLCSMPVRYRCTAQPIVWNQGAGGGGGGKHLNPPPIP
jgi:hypothetical protein